MQKLKAALVLTVVVLAIAGCRDDENKRLAEMAERTLERQAEQEARNTELQTQVAEGTRELVESDAAAREAIVDLHRDLQAEWALIGGQRDLLESERRQIASARNREPIIAEAIKGTGLLVACLVPLLIALKILHRCDHTEDTAAMAELLLNDRIADKPTLKRLVGFTPQKSNDPPVRRLSVNRRGDHDNQPT